MIDWITLFLLFLTSVSAQTQTVGADGCLRLLGSVACPGFAFAYVHPSNLSNAFPWMAGVNSVNTFDVAALNYFTNPFQFQQTKFVNQLGCNNASGVAIRWQRSVLCSNWVNSVWSRQCTANYNGTSAATSQKMICQSTCLQYSASERQIVNSSTFCPGPAPTDGSREARLLKDYVDCTEWTTLATNNTETCVQGSQNEGNCGYGSSTSQLCDFCRGSNPDACCYMSTTDVSVCGYTLPPRPSSSGSSSGAASSTASGSVNPSATAAEGNSGTGNGTPLSNGQLAGTIVGSILGGLLLLALLLLLFLCLRRRKHPQDQREGDDQSSRARPLSSLFSARGNSPAHVSEKGLIGANGPAGVSSPTMHSGTMGGKGGGMTSTGTLGTMGGSGAGVGVGTGLGIGAAAAAFGAAGSGSGPAGAGGRQGNVLPRVRDENQDGERFIEQGGEVTVLWPYTATLPDELDLRPGMKLRVVRLYDDAWGTAQVVSSPENGEVGKQGAFPIVCVSEGSSLGSTGSDGSH